MSESARHGSIDALSDAVRASGGALDAQTALWGAMFALEKWWFVARGVLPEVGPLVGTVDGVPSLLAFTSGARAGEFARANGFVEHDQSQVLAVPTVGILDMCDQFAAQGVQRIVVDQGTLGFFAPLAQLRPIHSFIHQQ
jgi:hypothetical protein